MNINEIAQRILTLRETRMTGYIMAGVLREELGFDGYGEALRRRWIEADMEQSGMVTITNNLGKVEEIRQLAAECKDRCGTCGKNQCNCEGRCDSCKGEKCACESQEPKPEAISETAHFFAQAHAFRRNAVGENEGMGVDPAAAPEEWDADMEEFYASNRPHFRSAHDQAHAALPPEELEKQWAGFEPGVRRHVHQQMFTPGSRYHGSYETWKRQRQPADPTRYQPSQNVDIGVNDSMKSVAATICEAATLGLGRTGDAPDMPVPGLGAGSAQKTQQAPIQAQSQDNPARPQAVAIGSDVAVVEGGKQYVGKVSRTLPDGKYEISFAGDQPPVRRAYDKTEVSTAAASAVAR